jgi:hypothetical protein
MIKSPFFKLAADIIGKKGNRRLAEPATFAATCHQFRADNRLIIMTNHKSPCFSCNFQKTQQICLDFRHIQKLGIKING